MQMVNAGDRLAMLRPGIPGQPGVDVYGNEIPFKPPKPIMLPHGKNTYESPDGLNLFSEINGQIVFEGDQKINVSPVFHVKENVDFSTGNIRFNGSVVVHGNVNAGFLIEADGNIEVMGIVEAADLKAQGDIIIRGGIQGSTTTRIIAGGAIRALYLQNAVVNAVGAVVVSDSVMNSVVQADEVRVAGKRGLLVGGLMRVQKGLFARVLGSHMGARTRIELFFYKQINESLHALEVKQAEKMQDIAKIEEVLGKLQQLLALRKTLTMEQMENRDRLVETLNVERQVIQSLTNEYKELTNKKQYAAPPFVEIGSVAYPGVTISTGSEIIELDEILHNSKFIHDESGLHRVVQ